MQPNTMITASIRVKSFFIIYLHFLPYRQFYRKEKSCAKNKKIPYATYRTLIVDIKIDRSVNTCGSVKINSLLYLRRHSFVQPLFIILLWLTTAQNKYR